jgi:ubiquinone/menaquinone biosynthesis C-methylase UbiE
MQNWKEIWNSTERVEGIILETLIKADGFDSKLSNFTTKQWLAHTRNLYNFIGITDGQSVFEVGCGSGAFLYPLKNTNKIGGLDYSSTLINLANKLIEGNFIVGDALSIEYPQTDIMVSNGVFLYFESYEYTTKVLDKMLQASNKIAILDVNNESLKEDYYSFREQVLNDYSSKYEGLDHLFFSKEFFTEYAENRGLTIIIEDQPESDNYLVAKFRFNVVIEK